MTTFTTQDRQDAQRKPVAWLVRSPDGEYLMFNKSDHPVMGDSTFTPLYTRPEPLSKFDLKGILAQGDCWIGEDSSMPNFLAFARAIERAHGIGE